jgi:hypothetical protein
MVAEVRALQALLETAVSLADTSWKHGVSMAATSIWFGRVTPMTKAFTNW